jgi:serine kinase of HPr protein (carbohydrate metabolism regulator)
MTETLHGTAVLAGVNGILIRGASGSGKSRLALALIERGARLVADDRVHIAARDGRVIASAPDRTAGLIELRGRGLIAVPHERNCVVRLVADIVSEEALDRMPQDDQFTAVLLGIAILRQPVGAVREHALTLVDAALASLSSSGNMGLRSARVWG